MIWLTILLSLLLPLVAACSAPSTTRPPAAAASPGELLYVLDGYSGGGASASQRLVAFHPGDSAASPLVSLPAGLTSLDHQRLYVATPQGDQTEIAVYSTQTGARLGAFTIPGTYSTGIYGYETGALSPSGRWLALRQVSSDLSATTIALVDTQARKLLKTEHLAGDFDLDALSPHAQTVYLLQNTNDAAHHYYVRAYDLTTDQLDQPIIVDKTEIGEDMQGTALTRQMAPDGSMSYTLYTNRQENKAFIHILPLDDQPNGYFARCLDLPVGSSSDLLAYYTLALSPDGSTLYAINTALGTLTRMTVQADYVFDIQAGTTQHFRPASVSTPGAPLPYNGAVVSSDGKTLYVAGVDGLWAFGLVDLQVVGHYLSGQSFSSVALSADGRMLYATNPAQGIVLFNLTTGQASAATRGPARSPWAITWVSN